MVYHLKMVNFTNMTQTLILSKFDSATNRNLICVKITIHQALSAVIEEALNISYASTALPNGTTFLNV